LPIIKRVEHRFVSRAEKSGKLVIGATFDEVKSQKRHGGPIYSCIPRIAGLAPKIGPISPYWPG
jgi:hypothetical protein